MNRPRRAPARRPPARPRPPGRAPRRGGSRPAPGTCRRRRRDIRLGRRERLVELLGRERVRIEGARGALGHRRCRHRLGGREGESRSVFEPAPPAGGAFARRPGRAILVDRPAEVGVFTKPEFFPVGRPPIEAQVVVKRAVRVLAHLEAHEEVTTTQPHAFPARAGMNRPGQAAQSCSRRVPRASGDEPQNRARNSRISPRSPRERG